MTCSVDIQGSGDDTLVVVKGDLDIAGAKQFRASTEGLEGRATNVAVNLADVDFIDSTGLGALVGLFRRLREIGGSMRIVATSDTVQKVFQITALDRVFPQADA